MMLFIIVILIVIVVFFWLLNATNLFFSEKNTDFVEKHSLMREDAKEILPGGNSEKAVMMIHGFASTPATYTYYVKRFQELGYDVLVPRLPGCGTSYEDFIKTHYTLWYAKIQKLYLKYRADYQYFHVMGVSLGGALALNLAEEFSKDPHLAPSSVSIAGTPVFLNSCWRDGVVRDVRLYFSGLLKLFIPFRLNPSGEEKNSQLEDGADRWSGYYGLFPAQLHSLKIHLKKIRKNLVTITVPLYISHARKDRTVRFENFFAILRGVRSSLIKSRCFDLGKFSHTRHVLFLYDSTRDVVFQDIKDFFQELENK